MKRLVALFALVSVALVLPGCPIYGDEEDGCYDDYDCARGYSCERSTGYCVRESGCESPSDCGGNETCSREGVCVVGDCTFPAIGCVTGYECEKPRGVWECVPEGTQGSGGSAGSGFGEAGGAGAPESGGAGGSE